ncbi:PREDICTED: protein FAM91A1-like [Priapulus caudatus]|uniref:Protein FAM91A1-like n=1 Tax=Priapulus caudatus TaxID=37621 RepID=A0ABM1EF65_PRICU|nr:PREDICTED: protein FAM91A1-like [Priapulus caudatus]
MSADIEFHIKNGYPWSKLPTHIKQALGNSQKEYDKSVVKYSVQNQLRYKGNLVRQVKRDEKKYYEEVLQYSREHLMLYPYHLSDVHVKGLRITPFSYYLGIMQDIMSQEKSYDSLPNFTAADCLRLLGIGRNQYIELMNQCRSSKKFFRRKPVKDLLPVKPVDDINIEPWWIVQPGYITEDDMKMCTPDEKKAVDNVIDNGPLRAGDMHFNTVHRLFNRGLFYLDVPIEDDDCITVPPLEGFVMNRVLGDYFETLLYKIFVSIDEHTNIAELANVLEIDLGLVKNAVSVFCRLSFARKKTSDLELANLHPSWNDYTPNTKKQETEQLLIDWDMVIASESQDVISESKPVPSLGDSNSAASVEVDSDSAALLSTGHTKRIAFLFDSTLTAFLMMGNLSPGLKNHAVTMFEVGKLSDESMDSFLTELEKVGCVAEGEAQRYFDHAVTLRNSIRFLRYNRDLSPDPDFHSTGEFNQHNYALQLLSFQYFLYIYIYIYSLFYSLLVSMAPLSNEIRPVSSCTPQHIGPAIPEVNSVWFKLFIYVLTGCGPPSLLLVKGTRLSKLPKIFQDYDRLLITVWGHDPSVVSTANVLLTLNDALSHSAVLMQVHGHVADGETVFIPFPIDNSVKEAEFSKKSMHTHRSIRKLCEELQLEHTCGFISMLCTGRSANLSARNNDTPHKVACDSPTAERRAEGSDSDSDTKPHSLDLQYVTCGQAEADWMLLDCSYGVPLFDASLNKRVCERIAAKGICRYESLQELLKSSRKLSLKLLHFIAENQELTVSADEHGFPGSLNNRDQVVPYPSSSLLYCDGKLEAWEGY